MKLYEALRRLMKAYLSLQGLGLPGALVAPSVWRILLAASLHRFFLPLLLLLLVLFLPSFCFLLLEFIMRRGSACGEVLHAARFCTPEDSACLEVLHAPRLCMP